METALEITTNSATQVELNSAGLPLSGGGFVDNDTAIYVEPIEIPQISIYIKQESDEVLQLDESTNRWIKISG